MAAYAERATMLAVTVSLASACVLVVAPHPGGDHCVLAAPGSDCAACLSARCQRHLDACCFDDACGDVVATLEQCARAHDASCTALRARVSSPHADEAQTAACAATECGGSCTERSGTSTTACHESRSGAATCDCELAQPTTDLECSESAYAGTRCCASPGWPGPALVCTCSPFVCVPSGNGCFCSLNAYAPPDFQATCGGSGLVCCVFNGTCQCAPGATCFPPQQEVATCSIDVVGCPDEKVHVAACSARTP
jgi:hypothetical protein